MVNFLQNVLNDGNNLIEDYKELLLLSMLYLGGWSENKFSFMIPVTCRQAKWIAKRIYALTNYTLHETFQLSSKRIERVSKSEECIDVHIDQ